MEQQTITAEEKSRQLMRAEEQAKRANANLIKARREERKRIRKLQDHHKFMMGGVVAKYFPECFNFDEQEMNRIIACAFSLKDVMNMVATVEKERPKGQANTGEESSGAEEQEMDDNADGEEADDEGET